MNPGLVEEVAARIVLPPPRTEGGMPLMRALANRHSSREFSPRELPLQLQSDLLWAAFGINRSDSGGRTAPSARNWREVDVYVAREDAVFLYEPGSHSLERVVAADLRAMTGMQDFVGLAPLNLVYVADLAKVTSDDPVERRFYNAADAAFIAQNVYLLCASEGLATVVRGMVDRRGLSKALALGPRQRVLFAQTVGFPAGPAVPGCH